MKIQCGQGYGCFRDCGSSVCTFQVAWQPRDQGVWFDVMVRTLSLAQKEWVAVGFSKDHMMVIVVERQADEQTHEPEHTCTFAI